MDSDLDYDLLTPEQELDLIARAQAHDLEARNELIVKNRRLIRRIAAKFFHNGVGFKQELDDLEQWGVFGLIRAIERFDLSKGWRLSTYSVPWIKASIYRNGMADDNTVSVSYNDTQRMAQIRRARSDLLQTLNYEPSIAEIAARCELKPEFVEYAMRTVMPGRASIDRGMKSHIRSVIEERYDGSTIDVYEIMPDRDTDTAEEAMRLAALSEIQEAITTLTPTEQEIMRRRWFCDPPQTHRQIAVDFNLSYTRIQQMEKYAMTKIKHYLGVDDINFSDPKHLSK